MHQHTSHRRRRTTSRAAVGTSAAALTLGACLCAGELMTTMPAMAATPVAAVSTAKAATTVNAAKVVKVKSAIRSTQSARTMSWGGGVKVTAKIIDPRTGKVVTSGRVQLKAWRNGRWINWDGVKQLGKTGVVSDVVHPAISGSFRWTYLGNSQFNGVTGGNMPVTVGASGAKVLSEAKSHTGALYKFGATGPSRFDCSGFTKYVYKKSAGKNLPRQANDQQRVGKAVSHSAAKPGDLIVFRSGSYGYHAAIYAGSGYMYDSPHTGARVGKHKIYGSNYVVRRVV